jgi:hypothetical protein
MSTKHQTKIQSTMGWKQARCTCGWWAATSYPTKAPAERDAAQHLKEVGPK